MAKKKGMLSKVIEWEGEGMSPRDEAKFFQELVDSGQAWRLQGAYGRRAMELIRAGVIMLGKKGHHDYYGNYVPSRYEVQKGTVGSPGYAKKMKKKLEEMM
jgi:hypothetical protein